VTGPRNSAIARAELARLALTVLAAASATLAAALLAHAADGEDRARRAASASASAYARADSEGRRGYVRVSGNGSRVRRHTSARASTAGGRGSARATARARDVEVFSGLVTARAVSVAIAASRGGRRSSGFVKGLAIEGDRRRVPRRGRSFDLNGYGRLHALRRGRGSIAGLRARLTKPYKDHRAGSVVVIAYASARASDAPPPPRRPSRDGGGARDEAGGGARERARPKPKRRQAPRLRALRTSRGYAFPVYGEHRFSDDWGAPRQFTGKHEGNDIFAAAGTPVVAVTGGRLFNVGTLRISGNRLWLKSDRGDHFFYAHLSSFAEQARNGREVEAGEVLGFVGSTGDAEKTPPHLHFEIRPRGGDAINPYPFLRAWEDRRDVPAAAWLERYGADPGARPGALVVVEDYLESR
jgi:murein DD-endopeptidase MepM/ murein hydrolase activator NlpD